MDILRFDGRSLHRSFRDNATVIAKSGKGRRSGNSGGNMSIRLASANRSAASLAFNVGHEKGSPEEQIANGG